MLAGLAALGYVGGGSDLAWWKIVIVALMLLSLMTGVARFLQANWQASSGPRRSATFLTASAGVLLLLGLTPLDRVQVPAPLLVLLVIAACGGIVSESDDLRPLPAGAGPQRGSRPLQRDQYRRP